MFNRTTAVTEKFASGRGKGENIVPTKTLEEFVGSLARPRKAQIMVKLERSGCCDRPASAAP